VPEAAPIEATRRERIWIAQLDVLRANNMRSIRRGLLYTLPSPVEPLLLEAMRAMTLNPELQWPCGRWDFDFYFPDAKLDVEVDGRHHDPKRDGPRDQVVLSRWGIETLRLPAGEVRDDPDKYASIVREHVVRRRARRDFLEDNRGEATRGALRATSSGASVTQP
jgi:very-short-patch-repair endonuclease